MSQHGPQDGPQEAPQICQKTVKNRFSLGTALGKPQGPQNVSKNGPKIVQNPFKLVPTSYVFLWLLRQFFITRFHAFLKLNALPVHLLRQVHFLMFFGSLFQCCFKHASWAAFWTQFFQLLKLKSKFDIFLEASWDPLGTILADFWSI